MKIKMSHPTNTLKAARNLISDPRAWCRGSFAKDQAGRPTEARGQDACSWCLLGALARVARDEKEYYDAITVLRQHLSAPEDRGLAGFNDMADTTHQDVVALLTKAIGEEQ